MIQLHLLMHTWKCASSGYITSVIGVVSKLTGFYNHGSTHFKPQLHPKYTCVCLPSYDATFAQQVVEALGKRWGTWHVGCITKVYPWWSSIAMENDETWPCLKFNQSTVYARAFCIWLCYDKLPEVCCPFWGPQQGFSPLQWWFANLSRQGFGWHQ